MTNVMIVNEEPDILRLITRILKNHEYNTLTCKTGKECLENFQEKKPDLILLDIDTPDIQSSEIYNEIKKQEEKQKIIFLTFFETGEILDMEDTEPEKIDHLIKPFKPKELLDKIENILE